MALNPKANNRAVIAPLLAAIIFLLAVASVGAKPAMAQLALSKPVASEATGTSNKNFRKQAVSRIPFNKMQPAVAKKISDLVKSAGLYRQLPVTTIQSDPDMYLFLLRYPETIISTWQLMGVSQMTARRMAEFQLQATDGAGTTTSAELVYGGPNLNIYYAEGEYEGPMLFRKVTGKCVIMIESDYRRGADGKIQVTSRMNFFLKIDNLAASLIAKTIHPLVGTSADHNFVETLKFAEKLSQTSGRNGPGVQRMATRLEGLRPEVKKRFQEIADLTYQRAQGVSQTPVQQTQTQTRTSQNRNGNSQHSGRSASAAVQAAYQQPTQRLQRQSQRGNRSNGVTHRLGDR